MKIENGIAENKRGEIAKGLVRLLADTYTLYLKTHNFHWNVTGSNFSSLHLMFETQYQELAGAVDEIAERVRALGFHAPGSYLEYGKLTSVRETEGPLSADEMVKDLVESHEIVTKTARAVFPTAADAKDEASVDLLTERLRTHEKTAWMLRSILERPAAA